MPVNNFEELRTDTQFTRRLIDKLIDLLCYLSGKKITKDKISISNFTSYVFSLYNEITYSFETKLFSVLFDKESTYNL